MALRLGTLSVDIGANTAPLRQAETEVTRTSNAMNTAFRRVGVTIAAAISVDAARRVLLIADNMQVLERRLVRFTGDAESAGDAMNSLVATASSVGAEVNDVVGVFQRFSLIRDEIGASNQDILDLTDTLSKMGAIGGSSGEELSNALRQLSQSFAGGILRAEEYNSIVEQAPEIIKRMADEMGVTMGEFRKEMLDGKITSTAMLDAIQASAADVDAEFANMPVSIQMATQALKNNLAVAIKNIDSDLDFSGTISKTITQFTTLIKARNTLYDRGEKLDAQQERLNKQLAEGSEEQRKNAEELNKILERRKVLMDAELKYQKSGAQFNGESMAGKMREQIDAINERVKVLTAESEVLKGIEKTVGGIIIKAESTGGPSSADTEEPEKVRVASKKEESEIEKLRQLGETEREEIARIAQERRDFIAEQTQLDAEEKSAILDRINEEEQSKINELAEAHLEQIRQLNETEIEEIERLAQEKRDIILAQDQLTADEQKLLLDEVNEYRLAGLQEQADKEVEIAKRAAADKKLAETKQFEESISGLTTAQESLSALNQTALGENKKLAAAQAAVSLAVSMAKASEAGFPANIPLLIGAAAQGAQIKSLLSGSGRQNGGQTSPQMITPVNELNIPEIYEEAGEQYLMPTGGSGKVIPLGKASSGSSGGGMPNITIVNNGQPANVTGVELTAAGVQIMINDMEKKITTSLRTGRGDQANALKSGFKLERNLNG